MATPTTSTIEVQVEKVGQLFDTLDPLPFRERDLDRHAEDYIVGWARELPRNAPVRLLVHLPASEASGEHALLLEEAMHRYFHYRAAAASGDLKELLRVGRYSLLVGLAVLAMCVVGGRFVLSSVSAGHLGGFLNEGLVILGWVANWRPIEIFLYDWWPIIRRRNLFLRLASAEVVLSPKPNPAAV
jgi:hypothetical protein